MPITPEDIQHKEFRVKLRGFDIEEVDTFLEEVAEDLFYMMQENSRLKDRVNTLENQVRELEDQEKVWQALRASEKKAEEAPARQETPALPSQEEEKLAALRNRVRDELRDTLNWYLEQLKIPAAAAPNEKNKPEEPPSLYEKMDLPETPSALGMEQLEEAGLAEETPKEIPARETPLDAKGKKPEKIQKTSENDSLFGPDIEIDHGPEPAVTLGSEENDT